ncbi:MAG: hypothetical protein HY882_16790 [Deltaproteobacteria bacterium]|nr:hypothetical protein [Deltaproteobacteria bacterium]
MPHRLETRCQVHAQMAVVAVFRFGLILRQRVGLCKVKPPLQKKAAG